MNRDQVNGILRHTMTGVGVAGFTVSHDDLIQLFGALVTFLSVVWSFIEKRQAAQRAGGSQPPGPSNPVLPLILLCGPLAGALLPGCTTTANFVQAVSTPERIEAVAALAGYAAGKAAIAKGHGAEVRAAVEALKVMQASGKADLAAVGLALQAAGINELSSPEGVLALGAVTSFQDLWANTGQPILDDARVRAVINGSLRGLNMALTAPRDSTDPVAAQLHQAAVATRPQR